MSAMMPLAMRVIECDGLDYYALTLSEGRRITRRPATARSECLRNSARRSRNVSAWPAWAIQAPKTTPGAFPVASPAPSAGAFEFTVKVSALVAAVFGILAWHEARTSVPEQAAAARDIKELRNIAAVSLDREEERLVLDRAMLASLERLLPEAGGGPLG
jgi:hypothetical protein